MDSFNHLMSSISFDRKASHMKMSGGVDGPSTKEVQHGFIRRHVVSRIKNVEAVPLEFLASLQNLIKLPFQIIGMHAKYFITTPLHFIAPKVKVFKQMDDFLPGIKKTSATAARAIGYFVGAFVTFGLGTIAPGANLWLHKKAHLFSDKERPHLLALSDAKLDKKLIEPIRLVEEKPELEQQPVDPTTELTQEQPVNQSTELDGSELMKESIDLITELDGWDLMKGSGDVSTDDVSTELDGSELMKEFVDLSPKFNTTNFRTELEKMKNSLIPQTI